jgi:hypothetical protein
MVRKSHMVRKSRVAMRLHYLQNTENRWIARSAGARHSLLVTLDRIAIGSILRSKLVFLISVQLHDHAFIEGALVVIRGKKQSAANILPSVWTLIMRAIKCLKGVRWMPWR